MRSASPTSATTRAAGRRGDADGGHPALAGQPDVCQPHRAAGPADCGRARGTLRRLRRPAGRRADRRRMARTRPPQRAVSLVAAGAARAAARPLPTRAPRSRGAAAARASFKDLLARRRPRVRLSTFPLENDAVVEPSLLLDEVPALAFEVDCVTEPHVRVSFAEALVARAAAPRRRARRSPPWAAARLAPTIGRSRPTAARRGRGACRACRSAGSSGISTVRSGSSRREVLRLEEQPEDEDMRTPLERGRFLHELWERFFAEWQRRGHGRITQERSASARALFERTVRGGAGAPCLRRRPRSSARAFSARRVSPGIAHRVFAMEAERPAASSSGCSSFRCRATSRFARRWRGAEPSR